MRPRLRGALGDLALGSARDRGAEEEVKVVEEDAITLGRVVAEVVALILHLSIKQLRFEVVQASTAILSYLA